MSSKTHSGAVEEIDITDADIRKAKFILTAYNPYSAYIIAGFGIFLLLIPEFRIAAILLTIVGMFNIIFKKNPAHITIYDDNLVIHYLDDSHRGLRIRSRELRSWSLKYKYFSYSTLHLEVNEKKEAILVRTRQYRKLQKIMRQSYAAKELKK